MTQPKEVLCHHCGQRIIYAKFEAYPPKPGGYWAHPRRLDYKGRVLTPGNERMDQRCDIKSPGTFWATPKRRKAINDT